MHVLRTCCVGSGGCDSESALTGENRVHRRQTLSVDSVWFARCCDVRERCLPGKMSPTERLRMCAHATASRTHDAQDCARRLDVNVIGRTASPQSIQRANRDAQLSGQSPWDDFEPVMAGRSGDSNCPRLCRFAVPVNLIAPKKLSYRRPFRRHYM